LNNLESPPPKNDLCWVWLKLAQWFVRGSRKCKSLQTDGLKTDNGHSEKLNWAFSSDELIKLNIKLFDIQLLTSDIEINYMHLSSFISATFKVGHDKVQTCKYPFW
jgi:hypothetical protein